MLTTGCQEGMAILLATLFDPDRDALLVSDPTSIGITGLARILGITLIGVLSGSEGLAPEAAAAAATAARCAGRRPPRGLRHHRFQQSARHADAPRRALLRCRRD